MNLTIFFTMDEVTLWIFLPIFLSMFLVALLQENLRILFLSNTSSGVSEGKFKLDQLLVRSNRLCANGSILPESSFRRHRAFFSNQKQGRLSELVNEGAQDSKLVKLTLSLIDSLGAGGAGSTMLRQYLLNFVPTVLLGVFINHFFSGYVVGRLPFPLPVSFKPLLHGGIYLPELDTCFLSSLSWYVLSLMGLRSIAALLLFDYAALESNQAHVTQQQQQQQQPQSMLMTMALGMPLPGLTGGAAHDQIAAAERNALHAQDVYDADLLGKVESRLLKL